MSDPIDIFKCLDYIRDHAEEYAQAKANRLYLEQYRKSQKALLMNQIEGAQHIREAYAYSNSEYLAVLESYKTAVEIEEKLKWLIESAKLKVEVWRSLNASNRFIDKVHT